MSGRCPAHHVDAWYRSDRAGTSHFRSAMTQSRRTAGLSTLELYLTLDGIARSQWAYAVTAEPQTIGRSSGCAIRVGDPTVSREHAVAWLNQGKPHIRDLG